MPNYYIVKYLLENWIIHSLFLREAGDSASSWLSCSAEGEKGRKASNGERNGRGRERARERERSEDR